MDIFTFFRFVSLLHNSYHLLESVWRLRDKNMGDVATCWRVSIPIVFVLGAETKGRAQTLAFLRVIVKPVMYSRRIVFSYPPQAIDLKEEKQDLKKLSDTLQKDLDTSSLIDPSSVTVVGAVDDQGMLKPSKSVDSKPSRSSADARIDELDQMWSDRLNRLETLLLSGTVDKPEPTFQAPKVTPTHPPPVVAVKSSQSFIPPFTDQPARSDLSGTDHTTPQGQVTSK